MKGRVVDGRNRLKAWPLRCEPQFQRLNGEDVERIDADNLNRRHLTKGQRAMSLAMITRSRKRVAVETGHQSRKWKMKAGSEKPPVLSPRRLRYGSEDLAVEFMSGSLAL